MKIKAEDILKKIKDEKIKFIDLRFTDTRGEVKHVTLPTSQANKALFKHGKMFDGSSIGGWKGIQESDMILMPDLETEPLIDPFFERTTLILRCNVIDPATGKGYERDPRSIALKAEKYLKKTGIADTYNVGPEPEFFLFEDVRWGDEINHAFYSVDSREGSWNSGTEYEGGNKGYRPIVKGGYFPVAPIDSSQDVRAWMCELLEELGLEVEAHHHEVATGGQQEIASRFDALVRKADYLQIFKYVVKNAAKKYNQTATFMPKPLNGDNGNGMHVHQSLYKAGKNLFSGNKVAGLSQLALHFTGGIIKHARVLNAFTNPTTNSYKRLIPGFEAPTILAYSSRNRSVAIRIPYVADPDHARIEVRFPDSMANPYLAFSAMLMAGLDGIENKYDPGEPVDKDVYDMSPNELAELPTVCHSLRQALESLDKDRDFLNKGGVFTNDLIDSYIKLKNEEVERLDSAPHPVEFDMYYNL